MNAITFKKNQREKNTAICYYKCDEEVWIILEIKFESVMSRILSKHTITKHTIYIKIKEFYEYYTVPFCAISFSDFKNKTYFVTIIKASDKAYAPKFVFISEFSCEVWTICVFLSLVLIFIARNVKDINLKG